MLNEANNKTMDMATNATVVEIMNEENKVNHKEAEGATSKATEAAATAERVSCLLSISVASNVQLPGPQPPRGWGWGLEATDSRLNNIALHVYKKEPDSLNPSKAADEFFSLGERNLIFAGPHTEQSHGQADQLYPV